MSVDTPRNRVADPLPWYDGGPVLSWLEYIARGQHPPIGVGIPGFRACQHCGLPTVYTRITDSVIGEHWEWRTPLGSVHDCAALAQALHDAALLMAYEQSWSQEER